MVWITSRMSLSAPTGYRISGGYAWAGIGAAFGPALILSLYWQRINRYGALAGIIVGGLTVVIWRQLSGGLFDLYEIVPGFVFSLLSIIIVSLFTQPPDKSLLLEFDKSVKEVAA